MKKRYKVLGAAFVMTATITIPVFAGTWVQDPARPANQGGMMTAVIRVILGHGWMETEMKSVNAIALMQMAGCM